MQYRRRVGQEGTAPAKASLLHEVEAVLIGGQGDLSPELRRAVFTHAAAATGRTIADTAPLPEALARFVDKVTIEAYKVVDRDIDALRQAGYTEDGILEAVLATALGAGIARLEIGLDALARTR